MIDLLEDFPAELKIYIPDYSFVLYDFSPYSSQEIKGTIKLRLFLEVMRYANTEEFNKRLEDCLLLIKKLDNTEEAIEYIRTTVKYLMNVNESIDFEELGRKSKKIITLIPFYYPDSFPGM